MSIYYIIKSSLVTPLPYLQIENNETIELGNKRTTGGKKGSIFNLLNQY